MNTKLLSTSYELEATNYEIGVTSYKAKRYEI